MVVLLEQAAYFVGTMLRAAENNDRLIMHLIEQSSQQARLQIVALSDDLSLRVLAAVLPAGVRPTEVAQ